MNVNVIVTEAVKSNCSQNISIEKATGNKLNSNRNPYYNEYHIPITMSRNMTKRHGGGLLYSQNLLQHQPNMKF